MNEVSFNVCYQPALIDKISKVMANCDLGIVEITAPIFEVWSWTTTSKIDKKYIAKMSEAIKKVIEERGDKFISVEYKQ